MTTAPTDRSDRRPDIQGLRAIAVLMVVAFHAGLPLPGGYLGVDVFFVVSGFVITAMLERSRTAERTVDLRRFYRRRFQRLTPALVVTVAVTVAASLLLLTPFGAIQEAARTGTGAIALVANFVIAKTTGGYFDAPAARNPLLHTWSLSVEEQIYLVFPALLVGAWWVVRRRGWSRWCVPGAVGLVGAGSFAIVLVSVVGGIVRGQPWISGFYSPVTRLWEFVAGALLAYVVAWRRPARSPRVPVATGLALVGVAGLVVAALAFDESTPTPGPATLVPVLATVAVIAAGSWVANPVSSLLSTRPLGWIGDRSYSIYLWHWPVIVFAALAWPGSTTATLLAALISFAPAVASYRFVEQPNRARTGLRGRRFARFAAGFVVTGLVVTLGAGLFANRVLEPWYDSPSGPVAHRGNLGWDNLFPAAVANPCTDAPLPAEHSSVAGVTPTCFESEPGRPVQLAVIGDSHALHVFHGLVRALPGTNVLAYAANGSPSADDRQFAAAVDWAAGPDGPPVVLLDFWWRRPIADAGLRRAIRTIEASGRTVVLTDDVPDFPYGAERCKFDLVLAPHCTIPRADFTAEHAPFVRQMVSVARDTGATFVPTADLFCDRDRCSMIHGADLVYRDHNHVNRRGSSRLGRRIVGAIPELAPDRSTSTSPPSAP